jgi:hypothetical protein
MIPRTKYGCLMSPLHGIRILSVALQLQSSTHNRTIQAILGEGAPRKHSTNSSISLHAKPGHAECRGHETVRVCGMSKITFRNKRVKHYRKAELSPSQNSTQEQYREVTSKDDNESQDHRCEITLHAQATSECTLGVSDSSRKRRDGVGPDREK